MAESSGYDTMTYNRCGRSGLKLPALSLGGWQTVGGYEDAGVARTVFRRAFELGITHFDFANNYGRVPGSGELEGGKILRELPRDEIVVSTKAGYLMWPGPYGEWGSRKYLIASCDQSLERLGMKYVDIFYSHRFDPETPLEETLGALDTIVRSGRALYAGISNYSGAQTQRAAEICRRNGWTRLLIHQPKYNMLHRDLEKDLLPVVRRLGLGMIVFSPLAQGLLSGKYLDGVPTESRAGQTRMPWQLATGDAATLEKVRRLNDLARERGESLSRMALAWCRRLPEVTSVLTAVSSVAQLEDGVKALSSAPFSAAELRRIDAILGASRTQAAAGPRTVARTKASSKAKKAPRRR
jgi:L-glyceraldehyde 3-phosphate reductase